MQGAAMSAQKGSSRGRNPISGWIRLLSFAGLLLLVSPLQAAKGSGASFLKIPVGAKAAGLGSAFTAVASDVSAIYWNPGCLARMKGSELGLMRTELYGDTRLDFLGYAQATRAGNFGIAATYLTQQGIQGRDSQGRRTSDFTASDLAMMLNYSRLVKSVGLGVNLKYIRQRIADASASGLALDLGASYRPMSKVRLGFAVQHLGPGMKFTNERFSLPLTVSAGAGYIMGGNFLVSADVRHRVYENKTSFSIGTELQAFQGIYLRSGYLAGAQAGGGSGTAADALLRISVGFGLKLNNFTMDYSFMPMGELGNAQRMSIGKRF